MTKRLALCAACCIGLLATAPAGAQTIGVNSMVVNDVRMTTEANPELHRAQLKERIAIGKEVRTGNASALQVLLLDRTNFQVGGNARVTIDRFIYDPSRSASAVGVSVAKGAFRFMSGKATHANPGQSSIRTPVATIGIRGTIVEGVVGADAVDMAMSEPAVPRSAGGDRESASLVLLRGPGKAAQGETPGAIDVTAGGSTVAVEQDSYAVYVPAPGQAPIGPFRISDKGLARLAALLGDPGIALDGRFRDLLYRNPTTDWNFEPLPEAPIAQDPILF